MRVEITYVVVDRILKETIENVTMAKRISSENTDYFYIETENEEHLINMEYVRNIRVIRE